MQYWIGLIGLLVGIPLTYYSVVLLSRDKGDRLGFAMIILAVLILLLTLGLALLLNLRDA